MAFRTASHGLSTVMTVSPSLDSEKSVSAPIRFNLAALRMSANAALWTVARERRLHGFDRTPIQSAFYMPGLCERSAAKFARLNAGVIHSCA